MPAVARAGAPPRRHRDAPGGRGDERVVALEHDERLGARGRRGAHGAGARAATACESTSSSRPSSPACGVRTVGQRRCAQVLQAAGERVEPVGVEHERDVDALDQLAHERLRALRAAEAGAEHDGVRAADRRAARARSASVESAPSSSGRPANIASSSRAANASSSERGAATAT